MKCYTALAATIASLAFVTGAGAETLMGFDTQASDQQRALEVEFNKSLSASDQLEWMRKLSARPHHVGSADGKLNAEYIASLFREWGYAVEMEVYDILLPVPKLRKLAMIAPEAFTASLTERTLEEDPSTAVRESLLPPYNAFSVDGEVEGDLVFVNYGVPEDYELLARYGIDVAGKIVIAKYGGSWRGIKPKVAAEHGAIGCLIYSDPADDGYARGDVYPDGAFKHETGVQRGAVMDLPLRAGDVLTPFEGADKRARRLDLDEVETLTRIPVLPISWADALPLLRAIGGPVTPHGWRGALPITYHLGPGPSRVRLEVQFDWQRVPAYDVIATLEGATYPDQWIVRGNHHDGWNHGAADPISGLVALLSEAKAIALLARRGERPSRTLVFAAWDAEEPGLIGSTEWAEDHRKVLDTRAVAYINTDGNSRGFIGARGSHTLEKFVNQVLRDVTDPQTGESVAKRRKARMLAGPDEDQRKDAKEREDLHLAPLGSGSDYTPFLQHLGIASTNIGFGGEGPGGSYHTLYDTFDHYTRFRDPGLAYGVALADVTGRITLRLANAPVVPFEFKAFAESVSKYVEELKKLSQEMREETERQNRMIEDGTYALALDPTTPPGPPELKPRVPHFNFAPLDNAVGELERSADAYDEARSRAESMDAQTLEKFNRLLYTSERLLTREEGLPGRPWYRHYIYAPGFYTGYGVKTIPGVREAIEEREYSEVEGQIEIAAEVLERFAGRIDEIVSLIPPETEP